MDACYSSVNSKTLCNSASKPDYHKPLDAGSNPTAASFLFETCATQNLASGAEVGAAVLHGDSLDGTAANRAGFASPMGNLEIEMGGAQLALGADVGIDAGALAADGCSKNAANTVM